MGVAWYAQGKVSKEAEFEMAVKQLALRSEVEGSAANLRQALVVSGKRGQSNRSPMRTESRFGR